MSKFRLDISNYSISFPFVSAGFLVELLERHAEHGMYTELREQICQWVRELRAQDTRIGISSDKLAGVWDAFTQTADRMRRGVEGLGIF